MRRLALLLLLAVLLAPHAYAEDATGAQADAMAAAPATSAQGVTIRGRNPYVFTEVLVGGDLAPARLTQDIRNLTGRQRMELRPIGGRIRKVVLNDVALPQSIDLGLEELGTAIDVEGRPSVDAVAIDPTRIVFGSGTFTKQAVGNKVWKCALWNFTAARCDGDWETILVVTPGQEYEVAFNATDPAYVETFNENESLDVSLAALDNTTLVIAYIDTSFNASFEIWSTNGVELVSRVNIDTTGDSGSRIEVDAINATHFVIGVLDGPLDDFNFYIYDRTGAQTVGLTQIDPNMGTVGDVGVCEMGDRFGAVWADQNDGDANYEVWSDTGASIFAESQVDISIGPAAAGQNLVSCAAMNSTHVGYAFYDDADNDATLAIFRETGTIQVTEVDIDNNVGETGQVAVAGMRNNRVAMAFYDSTDQDLTITVRDAAGNALNTILAVTDIDLTAGTDSRVSVAEIEHSGASDFVVAWQDQAAGDIKAGVYDNGGTQITAPFTITTAPNASFPLLDVAGYSSNLGIGLCNGTFAIVYTNASGSTVLEKYWLNGSAWNGHCGEPPAVDNATMAASYVLNAGTTRRVECNISASDLDGGNTIASANATLYFQLNTSLQADNPLEHYSNASCTSTGTSGLVQNFTCGFDVWYLARNGTWYCEGVVVDATGKESFGGGVGNTTIDPLYALNVTNTSMDFGRAGGGSVSNNISQNISNVGNQRINVTALAYGRDPGDGISFACATNNISVDALRFAPNITAGYAAKEVMSSSFKQLRLSVPSPVAVGSPRMNTSYWQLLVPPLNASDFGLCNGTIVFQAEFG